MFLETLEPHTINVFDCNVVSASLNVLCGCNWHCSASFTWRYIILGKAYIFTLQVIPTTVIRQQSGRIVIFYTDRWGVLPDWATEADLHFEKSRTYLTERHCHDSQMVLPPNQKQNCIFSPFPVFHPPPFAFRDGKLSLRQRVEREAICSTFFVSQRLAKAVAEDF
jgi:hypothetical protein